MRSECLEVNAPLKFYKTDAMCKLLQIGRLACYELYKDPEFPVINIGRAYMVEEKALFDYLSKRHIFKTKKEDLEIGVSKSSTELGNVPKL